MKSQMEDYPAKTLAIWGVAGGNGLEHVSGRQYRKVFGIDVNAHYLEKCRYRYPELQDILELCHVDLLEEDCHLPTADEIIINLLVEYIGIACLVKQVQRLEPQYISCVIQQNPDDCFVSQSSYQEAFGKISELHQNIDREKLLNCVCKAGYRNILAKEYPLPNGKLFVRLDFTRI